MIIQNFYKINEYANLFSLPVGAKQLLNIDVSPLLVTGTLDARRVHRPPFSNVIPLHSDDSDIKSNIM